MSVTLVVGLAALAAAAIIGVMARTGASPVDPEGERRWIVVWLRQHRRVGRVARAVDERVAGGLMLVVFLAVVFAGALGVGLLFDMVDQQRGLARWDSAVAEWGSDNATDASTRALDWITDLGATGVVAAMLVVVAVFDYRRHTNRHVVIFLASVLGGVVLVNNLLKLIVDRDRPSVVHLVETSSSSFPSGHSATATAGWLAAAFVLTRHAGRRSRSIAAAAATLIAALVAASRALLGVHWLTDVLAGMTVGWTWFMLAALAFGGRMQHLGEPVTPQAKLAPAALD